MISGLVGLEKQQEHRDNRWRVPGFRKTPGVRVAARRFTDCPGLWPPEQDALAFIDNPRKLCS
jgi:hypothetical protein